MAEIKVNAGGSLQTAIDNAQPGDVLSLEAGATFRGPIVLPAKNSSTEIVIQSSRVAELPQARVNPSHSGLMPKIICTAFEQAIRTKPGASFLKFDGIEVLPDPNEPNTDVIKFFDLVRLGEGRQLQATLESVPHHLKIDRCYIHGLAQTNFQRSISLNSSDTEVTRCYIPEIHGRGMDAQTICSWNTPGRLKIEDCYLEASGENFLLGGADPAMESFIPTDVQLLRCHVFKPLSWKGVWTVKNLLEIKNGKNVLIDGNVFENNWTDAQSGVAILFTVRNQEGTAPYSVILNVTFTNNTVKNSEDALNFLGSDNEKPSQRCSGALIQNNLFVDISRDFVLLNGYDNVRINRNTHLQGRDLISLNVTPSNGFEYSENLTKDNPYGIIGEGLIGQAALDKFTPGGKFSNNVIANPYSKESGAPYPAGNDYPASLTLPADFRSPFVGKGCDVDRLLAAQSGSVTGPVTEPTPTPSPAPVPTQPVLRKVSWPTGEAKQNVILDTQWKERYRMKRHLSGAYAEFEKVP